MGDTTDNDSQDPQLEDLDPAAEDAEEGEVDGFMLEGIVAPKIIPPRPPIQVPRPKGIDPIAGVRG